MGLYNFKGVADTLAPVSTNLYKLGYNNLQVTA